VLFAAALALMPVAARAQFGGGEYVRASTTVPAQAAPGKPFNLTVRLDIQSGYHIQANNARDPYIPTKVEVAAPRGFEIGAPVFPASITATVAGETIPVYEGQIDITVPITPPENARGQQTFTVKVRYQACNAQSCFPPTDTTATARVSFGAAEKTADDVQKDLPSSPSSPSAGSGQALTARSSPGKEKSVGTPTGGVPRERGTGGESAGQAGASKSGADGSSVQTPPSGPDSAVPGGGSAASPLAGYRMSKITQFVPPAEFIRFLETGSIAKDAGAGKLSELLRGGNLLLALPLIFLLGLALNLTPCVYPIIPITISYFGAQSNTGQKPLKLAIFYVLGMAAMYSVLGVAAGLTGGLFGSQLQNPWVLGFFALVMFALALSQFDRPNGLPIWEFQLPAALRNKATSRSGAIGAMLMGLMVGVVAAPCIGPAVIALLQWVGTQQSPVLGFITFFTLALGLGLPYVALATVSGSVKKLPRSGEWMVAVKHIFGVVMIWMGFFYLQNVFNLLHPKLGQYALVAVTALGGLYLLFIDRAGAQARKFFRFKQALGAAALALAVWVARPAPPETIQWQPYSETALQQARAEGRKVLVDFTAAWCAACKELEHNTFSDKTVGTAARDFVALRADMTNFNGPQGQAWQKQYGIVGLPTVVRLVPED